MMSLDRKTLSFVGTFLVAVLASTAAFAADGGSAAGNAYSMYGYFALAAGFGIGIAAFGGALAQGYAAAAAMEGIARNPGSRDEVFTPLILALALIESLVIYALVIAFFIQGNIDLSMVG